MWRGRGDEDSRSRVVSNCLGYVGRIDGSWYWVVVVVIKEKRWMFERLGLSFFRIFDIFVICFWFYLLCSGYYFSFCIFLLRISCIILRKVVFMSFFI